MPPWPVEIALDTRPHRLHNEARISILDIDETLEAKNAMGGESGFKTAQECIPVADGLRRDDKALEIIMVVVFLAVPLMVRLARLHIVLGTRGKPQQDAGWYVAIFHPKKRNSGSHLTLQ